MFVKIDLDLVKIIGITATSVYGLVELRSNGSGYCYLSCASMAEELHISTRTVLRALSTLRSSGLLEDTTPELRNHPHRYRLGVAIDDFVKSTTPNCHSSVTDCHSSGATNCHGGVTECHSGMPNCHSHCDKMSQDKKEELKELLVEEEKELETTVDFSPEEENRYSRMSAYVANTLCVLELTPNPLSWGKAIKKLVDQDVLEEDILNGYRVMLEKGYTMVGAQSLVIPAINAKIHRLGKQNAARMRSATAEAEQAPRITKEQEEAEASSHGIIHQMKVNGYIPW